MLLRSSALAKELGLTKQTVVNLANERKIPCIRLPSGHYRFDLEEVRATLTSDEVEPKVEGEGEGKEPVKK